MLSKFGSKLIHFLFLVREKLRNLNLNLTPSQKELVARNLELEDKIITLMNNPIIDVELVLHCVTKRMRETFEIEMRHLERSVDAKIPAVSGSLEFNDPNDRFQRLELFQTEQLKNKCQSSDNLQNSIKISPGIQEENSLSPERKDSLEKRADKVIVFRENKIEAEAHKQLHWKSTKPLTGPFLRLKKNKNGNINHVNLYSDSHQLMVESTKISHESFVAKSFTNQKSSESEYHPQSHRTSAGAIDQILAFNSMNHNDETLQNEQIDPNNSFEECQEINAAKTKKEKKEFISVSEYLAQSKSPQRTKKFYIATGLITNQVSRRGSSEHLISSGVVTLNNSVESAEIPQTIKGAASHPAKLYWLLKVEYKPLPPANRPDLKKAAKEKIVSELLAMNSDINRSRASYAANFKRFLEKSTERALEYQQIRRQQELAKQSTVEKKKISENTDEKGPLDSKFSPRGIPHFISRSSKVSQGNSQENLASNALDSIEEDSPSKNKKQAEASPLRAYRLPFIYNSLRGSKNRASSYESSKTLPRNQDYDSANNSVSLIAERKEKEKDRVQKKNERAIVLPKLNVVHDANQELNFRRMQENLDSNKNKASTKNGSLPGAAINLHSSLLFLKSKSTTGKKVGNVSNHSQNSQPLSKSIKNVQTANDIASSLLEKAMQDFDNNQKLLKNQFSILDAYDNKIKRALIGIEDNSHLLSKLTN